MSLDWLTTGETVAYIAGGRYESVSEAMVDKVGKRDVVVTVNGREQKFNIKFTTVRGRSEWLHRRGSSTWDRGTYLAPLDDPAVIEIRAQAQRDSARSDVRRWADEFQKAPGVESARKLQAAVGLYLKLHEAGEKP